MADRNDVSALVDQLTAAKAVDLQAVSRSLPGLISKNPVADEPGVYILGGDHYVLVCGASPVDIGEVEGSVDVVRSALER